MRHHDDGINDCFAKWVITAPPTTTDLSWYCAGCTKRRTLRTGSIFENHSISERQILLLLYCWANRFTTDQTKKECKTSENTLNCFNKLFRDICGRYNKRHPLKLGGYDGDGEGEQGHRLVVEVGRNFLSAVRRRKTNASRNAEQREGWLIYGVDRKTGAYFLQRTDDCQPQTVREVLAKYVLPGTRIITEGDWAKNMGFRESGYTHDMLRMQGPNKTKGFVDRKDPTLHTNNRKVVWKQINKTVSFQRQRDLEAYLHQLVFFKRVRVRGHGVFQSMILAIQEEYRAGSLWSPDECNMTSDQIFAWPGFGEPAKLDQCVQVNTGPGGHFLPHPAGFRQSVRAPGPVVFLPPTYPSIVPLSQGFHPSVRPAPVRLPAPLQQVVAPRLPLPSSLPTQPVPRVVRRVVIRLPAATSMSGQEANDTLARLAEVLKRRQPSSGEDADDGPSASKKVKTESADVDGDGEGQESGETEEGGEEEEDRDDGEPIMVAPTFEAGVELRRNRGRLCRHAGRGPDKGGALDVMCFGRRPEA